MNRSNNGWMRREWRSMMAEGASPVGVRDHVVIMRRMHHYVTLYPVSFI